MYVGLDWIFRRGATLTAELHNRLAAVSGVEVVTPGGALAGIVTFRIPGWPVDDALTEVRRRVFAIVSQAPGLDAVRASVSWFNTSEEIDRFVAAVAELARYTPETLPRRPTLLVH
jgi:selenocysteine lyase/cysteine desulfurase